jgi:hypothetical protein
MIQTVHLGDVGTVLESTIYDRATPQDPLDLTTATELTYKFKKPSGAIVTKTALLAGAGTAGKIRYTFVAGDLDELGTWRIQGHVVLPTGSWSTSIEQLKCVANI